MRYRWWRRQCNDGIDWTNHPSGKNLTVDNDISVDMVLFQGQTPLSSAISGGARDFEG
ncbi:MAG: hypothetical protein LBG43_06175 [Treponema sp.]|nr:hypothetical protein [Treponema sp.]